MILKYLIKKNMKQIYNTEILTIRIHINFLPITLKAMSVIGNAALNHKYNH